MIPMADKLNSTITTLHENCWIISRAPLLHYLLHFQKKQTSDVKQLVSHFLLIGICSLHLFKRNAVIIHKRLQFKPSAKNTFSIATLFACSVSQEEVSKIQELDIFNLTLTMYSQNMHQNREAIYAIGYLVIGIVAIWKLGEYSLLIHHVQITPLVTVSAALPSRYVIERVRSQDHIHAQLSCSDTREAGAEGFQGSCYCSTYVDGI